MKKSDLSVPIRKHIHSVELPGASVERIWQNLKAEAERTEHASAASAAAPRVRPITLKPEAVCTAPHRSRSARLLQYTAGFAAAAAVFALVLISLPLIRSQQGEDTRLTPAGGSAATTIRPTSSRPGETSGSGLILPRTRESGPQMFDYVFWSYDISTQFSSLTRTRPSELPAYLNLIMNHDPKEYKPYLPFDYYGRPSKEEMKKAMSLFAERFGLKIKDFRQYPSEQEEAAQKAKYDTPDQFPFTEYWSSNYMLADCGSDYLVYVYETEGRGRLLRLFKESVRIPDTIAHGLEGIEDGQTALSEAQLADLRKRDEAYAAWYLEAGSKLLGLQKPLCSLAWSNDKDQPVPALQLSFYEGEDEQPAARYEALALRGLRPLNQLDPGVKEALKACFPEAPDSLLKDSQSLLWIGLSAVDNTRLQRLENCPLITEKEALKAFAEGRYTPTIADTILTGAIRTQKPVYVDLDYQILPYAKYTQPYYRLFFENKNVVSKVPGLKQYICFYVPAALCAEDAPAADQ